MLSAGTPADGAQLSGYFRHSSVDGWINYAESFQSAETGPLSDTAQLPAIFGQYRVDYGRISAYSRNDGLTDHPAESQFRGTNAGTSAGSRRCHCYRAGMPLGSPGTMQVRSTSPAGCHGFR